MYVSVKITVIHFYIFHAVQNTLVLKHHNLVLDELNMVLSFCIALKENIIIPENENTEITYKIEKQLQPEYTNVS